MIRTIRISGFGGQGVMLTGQLLAHAANAQGLYSLWVPTYGPETRGGTANCAITISDEPIHSPVFKSSDDLLAFNEPSFVKFSKKVKEGGNAFYNSTSFDNANLDEKFNCFPLSTTELATKLGKPQVANMIMLGAYLEKVKLVKKEVVLESLKEILGPRKASMLGINKEALDLGAKTV